MQNKNILIFVESYVTGGSDKIARLLLENLKSKKTFLVVNKDIPKEILIDNLPKENIEVIYYSLISPAKLGLYAQSIKSKPLRILCRIFNLLIRYPLIIFSVIYFYFLMKRLNIDLYISNNGGYPGGEYNRSSSLAASFLLPLRKVLHIYHSLPREYPKIITFIERLYDRILDKRVSFITDSYYCAKELTKHRSILQDSHIIYNGVFRNTQKGYKETKTLKLLQIGTLDSNKNQLLSLKAIKELKEKNYDIKLYMVGKEAELGYKDQLIDFVKKNSLDEFISFEGFQTNPYQYYKDCDILLLTSYIESFPTVILEAMSVGMPIIATNTGGVSEQIDSGKNGFVIEQNNLNELIDSINIFYKDRDLISKFGHSSFKHFNDKFTIEKMIDKYNNFIRSK